MSPAYRAPGAEPEIPPLGPGRPTVVTLPAWAAGLSAATIAAVVASRAARRIGAALERVDQRRR